jgi:hypothetical protein
VIELPAPMDPADPTPDDVTGDDLLETTDSENGRPGDARTHEREAPFDPTSRGDESGEVF